VEMHDDRDAYCCQRGAVCCMPVKHLLMGNDSRYLRIANSLLSRIVSASGSATDSSQNLTRLL
jgi:hypothetical protein